MKNLFSVEGKVAVVTGGSRGIGAMIARGFVENGVKTYITARKEEELKATAQALSAFGECIAIASDLSTVAGLLPLPMRLKSAKISWISWLTMQARVGVPPWMISRKMVGTK